MANRAGINAAVTGIEHDDAPCSGLFRLWLAVAGGGFQWRLVLSDSTRHTRQCQGGQTRFQHLATRGECF